MLGIHIPFRLPVARGMALFLAAFTLLNLVGSHLSPGFDANSWWIDLRYLPPFAGKFSLAIASAALFAFAIGRPDHWLTRRLVSIAIGALTIAVSINILSFYWEWFTGRIRPGIPIPLSLLLSIALGFVLRASFLPWKLPGWKQRVVLLMAFLASFFLFPLAQMYCFGKTDYRRQADAAVVFGARAYADGSPSQVLEDRVRTAVELYRAKLVPLLIFSGGPGDGPVSEPEAMRTLAMSLTVPASAIILDEQGLTTEKTVENTTRLFTDRGIRKVLAVSTFYHLPRIKMTYSRELTAAKPATEIYTVPATEPHTLTKLPLFMAREVIALWFYYLKPLSE
jgi:vancomycin permeability regulator SanA